VAWGVGRDNDARRIHGGKEQHNLRACTKARKQQAANVITRILTPTGSSVKVDCNSVASYDRALCSLGSFFNRRRRLL
jgi:hypothetical protein